MRVAIVKQGFWRAVAVAAVFAAALATAAPAAQAHWWVHRPFVRPWHHVTYHRWHPWSPRFYRPWWRPVFFHPFFGPPVFHRRVVLVRPPVVLHRVVVVHAPPRVVYRTRIVYRTAAVIHHPVVHHAVHHAPAIHYSGRNCGCRD
ncbi:MAG: hypothetical protein ACREFK_15440 [Stellaceae bacterium]